jgi:hypothetical protein
VNDMSVLTIYVRNQPSILGGTSDPSRLNVASLFRCRNPGMRPRAYCERGAIVYGLALAPLRRIRRWASGKAEVTVLHKFRFNTGTCRELRVRIRASVNSRRSHSDDIEMSCMASNFVVLFRICKAIQDLYAARILIRSLSLSHDSRVGPKQAQSRTSAEPQKAQHHTVLQRLKGRGLKSGKTRKLDRRIYN